MGNKTSNYEIKKDYVKGGYYIEVINKESPTSIVVAEKIIEEYSEKIKFAIIENLSRGNLETDINCPFYENVLLKAKFIKKYDKEYLCDEFVAASVIEKLKGIDLKADVYIKKNPWQVDSSIKLK